MSQLENIESYFTPELVARFAEVQQPRSKYQLEKFVINAHDTDEMRYYQVITELQSLYYTIKQVSLEIKKTEIEISRLVATGDEIDAIDAEIKQLGLEQTKVVAVGAFRELEILLSMLDSYPKYTREQIEQAQPDYWQKRLTRQMNQQLVAGPNAPSIEALAQIGVVDLPSNLMIGESK